MIEEYTLPELNDPQRLSDLTGSVPLVVTVTVPDSDAATASKYGIFFVAPFPCVLIGAYERHDTAGSDAGTVTLDIEKLTDGTAPGSGVSMLFGTFNLKGTASTYQSKTATATPANASLSTGEAMALLTSGTLTAVNHVQVTVLLKVLTKYLTT